MSDMVSCPFCGQSINHRIAHPSNGDIMCPLGGYVFSEEQWNMRPPKKEAPAMKDHERELHWVRSEALYLRKLVEKLTCKEAATNE